MRGPLLLLGALGLFALLDANSKLLSAHYPPAEVLAVRYATMLLGLLLLRLARPGLGGSLGTRHPRLHLLRAVAMLGASGGFLLSLRGLTLAQGYLVYFLAPFMILTLSALVLRERVPGATWGWCALGFSGVLVALAPALTGGGPLHSYGWALLGTASYATVMTVNRHLRHEAGMARLILWSAVPGMLVLLPFVAEGWITPTPLDGLAMAANGALSGTATLCLAGAFRFAPAARLAPLEFSALFYAVVLDLLVWGALPDKHAMAGAAVVVVAGVMSQRRATPA